MRAEDSCVRSEIPKTQNVKKNASLTDKTRQDANFRGNPLFQSYLQYKNKQITYLFLFLKDQRSFDKKKLKKSNTGSQLCTRCFVFVLCVCVDQIRSKSDTVATFMTHVTVLKGGQDGGWEEDR